MNRNIQHSTFNIQLIPYILTLSLLIITIVLGSYFDDLYKNEKLKETQVHIYPMSKTFIMPDEVIKLMNVKDSILKRIDIDSLEWILEQNGYIDNAEVYRDLNGRLVAEVEQYKPVARFIGQTSYYLDKNGNKKPLSKYYTEKVVLVYGDMYSGHKEKLKDLIKQIYNDKHLNEIVSEIHLNGKKIRLITDKLSAGINIDLNENIPAQLYKLKAIYSYLVKQNLTEKYRQIDLQFENQAVCK